MRKMKVVERKGWEMVMRGKKRELEGIVDVEGERVRMKEVAMRRVEVKK